MPSGTSGSAPGTSPRASCSCPKPAAAVPIRAASRWCRAAAMSSRATATCTIGWCSCSTTPSFVCSVQAFAGPTGVSLETGAPTERQLDGPVPINRSSAAERRAHTRTIDHLHDHDVGAPTDLEAAAITEPGRARRVERDQLYRLAQRQNALGGQAACRLEHRRGMVIGGEDVHDAGSNALDRAQVVA